MSESPQPPPQPPQNPVLMAFADDAAFRQRIGNVLERLVTVVERSTTDHAAARRALHWQVIAALALLTAAVIGTAGVLTYTGKMSADATAFLIGAVVGAAFTFARDVLLPPPS